MEDSNAGTDANFVMNEKGELLEVQGTAEGAPFTADELIKLMNLANQVMPEIMKKQLDAVK